MNNFSLAKLIINPERILKGRALGDIPSSSAVLSRTVRMAWPSIIDSFLAAIVGLIDMKMVSSLGTYAISSVGLATQPKFIVLCFFIAMSVAITAMVARRFGQRNREEANLALNQALSITLFASILLTTLSLVFAREFMLLAGALPDTLQSSTEYFQGVILGTVFCALTLNINAAQRGVGNTKLTMKTNVTANLVNLFFNYLLIEGNWGFPRLEVFGAGLATSIGWFVAFVIAVISLIRKNGYLKLSFKKMFAYKKIIMKPLMNVFTGAFLEQLCIRAGFFLFAIIVASLGTKAFATHQVVMSLVTISFAIGEGLSFASSALVGQTLGEERSDLSEVYTRCCQMIGMMLGAVCVLSFIILGREIIGAFDKDPDIIRVGYQILMIASPVLIFQIAQVVANGALRGAGDVKYVAIAMLLSVTIVRPSMSFLFAFVFNFGLHGIWIGFLLDQTLRFTLSYLRFRRGVWKKKVL